MSDFEYGPVELFLIGFDGDRPGPAVLDAILELVQADTVRLLDLLFVSRSQEHDLRVIELDEVADEYGLAGIEIAEVSLAGQEDVEDLAGAIAPGTSAAILVIEHRWVKSFAETLFEAGGRVLHTERIPAPVVNALVAAVSDAESKEGEQ